MAPDSRVCLQHNSHVNPKLTPYHSLYSFDPRAIHLDDDYQLSSPTAEEWLDSMTTMHNQIYETL